MQENLQLLTEISSADGLQNLGARRHSGKPLLLGMSHPSDNTPIMCFPSLAKSFQLLPTSREYGFPLLGFFRTTNARRFAYRFVVARRELRRMRRHFEEACQWLSRLDEVPSNCVTSGERSPANCVERRCDGVRLTHLPFDC